MDTPHKSADEAGPPANGGPEARRPWWRRVRPPEEGAPGASLLASAYGIPRWLIAQVRRILGFGMMRASAPLRNWSGEPIRARARLESAEIEERYRYSQEISLNADIRQIEKPAGLIKLVLPYDGDKYFTRQAHRDVAGARRGVASPADEAIVGFLALTGYEKTGLEGPLGLRANYGSVPVRVRLPAQPGPGETDQLLVDGSACVVAQEYWPEPPRVLPVQIEIELDDPDTAAASGEVRAKAIKRSPERQLDFEPDLWLRVTVRLNLPRTQVAGVKADVSRFFMSWPTHTSLSSLRLRAADWPQLRYNPEQEHEGRKGSLEWSGVPMALDDAGSVAEDADTTDGSADEIVALSSKEMTLSILKPGDLFKQDVLSGRVEVTVNRLLSCMDARLYDATGKQCQSRRPELKLKSIVTTEFSLPLGDAFHRRIMSPYQWLYFDEVIPSAMRIDDIMMALRNRGFKPFVRTGDPENCFIVADRAHGPDRLRLTLYVRGERYKARRERSVPGGMTYRTAVDSGELRIYVYGSLRAESGPVVHEINALRRALHERFDRLPAGR